MKKLTLLFTLLFTLTFSQYTFADQIADDELFYAVSIGDIHKTRIALENGADPDVANDESGFNALMASCLFSDHTITRLLLYAGADVNSRTTTGESALYYAVEKDDIKLARLLLEYGADAGTKTTKGVTLQQIARRNKNFPLMAMLDKSLNKITLENYEYIPYQTSLVVLDEIKILRARQEAEAFSDTESLSRLLYYPLSFNAVQNLIDEKVLKKSPYPGVSLITPYSLLRYEYAAADRKDTEVARDVVSTIHRHNDIVWLWVRATKLQPYIDNVVIRINREIYPSLSKEKYNLKLLAKEKIRTGNIWAFPIDLFSQDNILTEIIVSYPDGQRHIIKIKAEDFAKVPLK